MGHLKIITAILIWSSLGIFIRRIELPNVGIIFYTALIAGLLQFTLLTSAGLLKKSVKGDGKFNNVVLLVLVPVAFLANTLLFYFAFRNTTIANAVLTHYTAPVFVAFMAPLLLKEKIYRKTWFAIFLSSIGLWFILGGTAHEQDTAPGNNERLGIIAGALSGLAYAFLIIIIRKIATQFPSLFITFVQNSLNALMLLPFVLKIHLPVQALPYLVILGVLHSTIAPLLYVQGFRSVKANEAAILGYLEPVGAIILAFIFLNEVPGIQVLLGGALILYSGYMILRARAKQI